MHTLPRIITRSECCHSTVRQFIATSSSQCICVISVPFCSPVDFFSDPVSFLVQYHIQVSLSWLISHSDTSLVCLWVYLLIYFYFHQSIHSSHLSIYLSYSCVVSRGRSWTRGWRWSLSPWHGNWNPFQARYIWRCNQVRIPHVSPPLSHFHLFWVASLLSSGYSVLIERKMFHTRGCWSSSNLCTVRWLGFSSCVFLSLYLTYAQH